jgi:oligopeptide/dipeptide ABC transporter ATP-binding protein
VKENDSLLQVRDLKTYFYTEDGVVKAVDGISFDIKPGETLGVVGESGCGKSVTALSIMQLVPGPRGRIVEGTILYQRKNREIVGITSLKPHSPKMRSIRGNEIAMIFQEPMTSLNPVFTIGQQITEAIRLHRGLDKIQAWEQAVMMLDKVGIPNPEQRLNEYPHQLSGGMRQRTMIAMGLSCDPVLLIADEPTTALDVTIEAQILNLMKELQVDLGMSIMIITHDMGVIGEMADRVIVMYTGKLVESATTYQIFYEPRHPYTIGLLESIPQIGLRRRLVPIEGSVPNVHELPEGCFFAPRCKKVMERCHKEDPNMISIDSDHSVKCWLYSENE